MTQCPSLEDLLRYYDGEESALDGHIHGCSACREQIEFLGFVAENYHQTRSRSPSPTEQHLTPMDIAACVSQGLERESKHIQQHLARCGDCRDQLNEVREIITASRLSPARPSEEVRQKVIDLGQPWWERWARLSGSWLRKHVILRGDHTARTWLVPAVAAMLMLVIAVLVSRTDIITQNNPVQVVQPPHPITSFGFTERGALLYEAQIPLTEELQEAIVRYFNNKNARELKQIVALLRAGDPKIPPNDIIEVTASETVRSKIQDGRLATFRLYQNGELEILE